MSHLRRVIAMLLTLALMLGLFPAAVFAQEVSSLDTSELSVEGTDGLGSMLSREISAHQESSEAESAEYEEGFSISQLTISDSTATVRYCTRENASLVVSLYTEDGMQLLTSATAKVEASTTEASVTFDGEMPEYFQAAVFLLDTYDLAPLCPAYRTSIYTQEMQALLESTAADYDGDRVINLDDDDSSNFLVCAESTIIIEKQYFSIKKR